MAFTASTNVDGSNPGPNSASLPDTVQSPVGNIWKIGEFSLTLSPASVSNASSVEQTFTMTGLLTTDQVIVSNPAPQSGLGIVNSRVQAAGVIGISFANTSAATITPTAATAYQVLVIRVQPNWTAPATGSLLDW